MGFCKVPPNTVTRYLWVGGVHGMTVRQLAEIFVPYGAPEVLPPPPPPQQPAAEAPGQAQQATASAPNEQEAGSPPSAPNTPHQQQQDQQQLGVALNEHQQQQHVGGQRMAEDAWLTSHAFLRFESEGDAAAALAAVPRNAPWAAAGGRKLVANYADLRRDKRPVPRPVATRSDELGVPGLALVHEFVTPQQEAELLEAVQGVGEGEGQGQGREEQQVQGAGQGAEGGEGGGGGGTAWEVMARRRVQHYGFRFDYATRNVDPSRPLGPLPPWAAALAERIAQLPEVGQSLDQLTVNEYEPGVGLAPHVDTHSAFTGPIVVLSLGSATVMELRRGEAARPLLLPPRSLLVMAGEARYGWAHYIPHRVADVVGGQLRPRGRRVSLTFRQVRGYPCDCAWPDCCDSQQAALPPTRISQLPERQQQQQQQPAACQAACVPPGAEATRGDTAVGQGHNLAAGGVDGGHATSARSNGDTGRRVSCSSSGDGGGGGGGGDDEDSRLAALESEYVHKVYDAIAPHFSATRFAIWPKVREFIDSIPAGGVVADVGCGNGKYFGVRRDIAVLGSDISAGLAEVAAQRLHPPGLPPSAAPRADALVADALRLPYRPGSCDAVLCIAVLHHLTSRARRVRLLRQLLRVMRPGGGRAVVTVWATEQEDPAKTINKWTRIAPLDAAAEGGQAAADVATTTTIAQSLAATTSPPSNSDGVKAEGAHSTAATAPTASTTDGGADFFVPWHLPYHRAEAARAAKLALAAAGPSSGDGDGSSAAAEAPKPKLDATKSAVVFQRYYHLFTREELRGLAEEALVLGPAGEGRGEGIGEGEGDGGRRDGAGQGPRRGPCGVVEEVYYDKSNWCVVFRRDR